MSDDRRAGADPGSSFRVTRRGYDRDEVDRALADMRQRLAGLEDERNRLAAHLSAVGVDGGGDVGAELDAVVAEVAQVLEAARAAAETMRSRAADDAARWRQAAEEEASDNVQRAEQDAMALRGDAWRVGSELLQQVRQESERIRAAAEQDAILTRAEAEQEAHRLTASARKDIADESRLARLKSERMGEEVRIEAEQVRAEAQRDAEAAQERVRALEDRRAELMREVESARATLAGLEADLAERRHVAEPQPEPEPAPEPEAEPAKPEVPEQWTPGWTDAEGVVRIVSSTAPTAAERVDAEAMAAEVRAMRARREALTAGAVPAEPAEPAGEPEPAAEPEPGPAEPEAQAPLVAGSTDEADEPAAEVEPEPELPADEPALEEPDLVVEEPEAAAREPEPDLTLEEPEVAALEPEPDLPEPDLAVEEPADEEPDEAEPELAAVASDGRSEPEGGAASPPIDDLFARLRGGGAAVAAAPQPEPVVTEPAVAAAETGAEPEPRPPLRAVPAVASGSDVFELRDRLLLPLTNQALRSAKRAIVELQNVALEELRTSAGHWQPQRQVFSAELEPVLAALDADSRRAGALGAAELAGAAEPPAVAEPAAAAGGDVVDALVAGLEEVLARGDGAGPRQQSAAVSRLFRSWRTDEAERRIRNASFTGYHQGFVEACSALGVEGVMGIADGTTCAACPAATGQAWPPGEPPPNGTALPPAHPECTCALDIALQ